jgi:energy-coupling factor transport system ATP-binding protein
MFITHDLDLAVIYATRVLLVYDGTLVADGTPYEVLKDEKLLRSCRILPTSLLKLNLNLFSKTEKFYRAETLAHLQS